MTLRQALSKARELLGSNYIEDPALEAVLLLTHALKINRVQLYTEFDNQLSPEQSEQFRQVIERRIKGEPTAYILGHREFYGLDFDVDSNVLIPRPETELLVEKSLDIARDKALELARHGSVFTIADAGTGSGAIAISLAHKLPGVKIYATDISATALRVAAINCEKHGVSDRVILLEGDLLDPLPEPVDLIVANLPYVSEADLPKVNTHGFEPSIALAGGKDGIDKIRRLCTQLTSKLRQGGSLLMEIGQGQREAIIAFLRNLYPSARIESFADLAGIGRVISITLKLD